jgi:hypothetical protein
VQPNGTRSDRRQQRSLTGGERLFADRSRQPVLDVLVVAQLLRLALEDDSPALHQVAVVGNAQRQAGILLDQQDRDPLLRVDPPDDRE